MLNKNVSGGSPSLMTKYFDQAQTASDCLETVERCLDLFLKTGEKSSSNALQQAVSDLFLAVNDIRYAQDNQLPSKQSDYFKVCDEVGPRLLKLAVSLILQRGAEYEAQRQLAHVIALAGVHPRINHQVWTGFSADRLSKCYYGAIGLEGFIDVMDAHKESARQAIVRDLNGLFLNQKPAMQNRFLDPGFVSAYFDQVFRLLALNPIDEIGTGLLRRGIGLVGKNSDCLQVVLDGLNGHALHPAVRYFTYGVIMLTSELPVSESTRSDAKWIPYVDWADRLVDGFVECQLARAAKLYCINPNEALKMLSRFYRQAPNHQLLNLNLAYLSANQRFISTVHPAQGEDNGINTYLAKAAVGAFRFLALVKQSLIMILDTPKSNDPASTGIELLASRLVPLLTEAIACPRIGPEYATYGVGDAIVSSDVVFPDIHRMAKVIGEPTFIIDDRALAYALLVWAHGQLKQASACDSAWLRFNQYVYTEGPTDQSSSLLLLTMALAYTSISEQGPWVDTSGLKTHHPDLACRFEACAGLGWGETPVAKNHGPKDPRSVAALVVPPNPNAALYGWTPGHLAVFSGTFDPDANQLRAHRPDLFGFYPIHYALKLRDIGRVKGCPDPVVNVRDPDHNTVFHLLFHHRWRADHIKDLLAAWQLCLPDYPIKNKWDQTVLHVAVINNSPALSLLVRPKDTATPSDRNVADQSGRKPFHYGLGHAEIEDALFENILPSVPLSDRDLVWAIRSACPCIETPDSVAYRRLALVFDRYKSTNSEDTWTSNLDGVYKELDDLTILEWVSKAQNEVLYKLIDQNFSDLPHGSTFSKIVSLTTDPYVWVSSRGRGKQPLYLHEAISDESIEGVTDELRLRPFSVSFKNSDGQTALHAAVRMGNLAIFKMVLDATAGFDLNAVDNDGQTIVHYLAKSGRIDLLRVLDSPTNRGRGIIFHSSDRWGYPPVHYAVQAVLGKDKSAPEIERAYQVLHFLFDKISDQVHFFELNRYLRLLDPDQAEKIKNTLSNKGWYWFVSFQLATTTG